MLSWPRVVAISALIALIPVGLVVPALALGIAVVLIVGAVVVWDTLAYGGSVHLHRELTK